MPKVSIIIPTYNRQRVIESTVRNVLSQTEQDLEVIVVDDGSSDDTRAVFENIKDSRVKYFYKPNGGAPSARNLGLVKAHGKYVAFLDHDDLWPGNYLEVMSEALDNNTDFGLAYSPITLSNGDGSQIVSYKKPQGKSGWLTKDLFKNGFIWTSASLIGRSELGNLRYDESLRRSYEDGDFFLRLSMQTKYLFVDGVQAIKRQHDMNLSTKTGVLTTRILVLERFCFQLGGNKIIPRRVAMKRLSHACRKVAGARRREGDRTGAILLYKRAIKYWPFDLRLYVGLGHSFLLNKTKDQNPNWQMPEPLGEIVI